MGLREADLDRHLINDREKEVAKQETKPQGKAPVKPTKDKIKEVDHIIGKLGELGLCGLYVPEDDGGLGMGPVEGMVVMEELGRGIVLEPLTQTLIAGGVLAMAVTYGIGALVGTQLG